MPLRRIFIFSSEESQEDRERERDRDREGERERDGEGRPVETGLSSSNVKEPEILPAVRPHESNSNSNRCTPLLGRFGVWSI